MSATALMGPESPRVDPRGGFLAQCPYCSSSMFPSLAISGHVASRQECTICGAFMEQVDSIWRALPSSRAAQLASSLETYESIRKAEGRWSHDPEFYRALPWRDTTGKFTHQWRIRSRSFSYVVKRLLPGIARFTHKLHLRILDVGAGNCWMSYQLALRGHFPVAVDISVNSWDGLGAARHYDPVLPSSFPRFQAEMNRLPFTDEQFDVVVFNASFHYSADYPVTLREALRVIPHAGAILIVDSPTYPTDSDGEAMKKDKSREFVARFGTDHGNMGGRQYLTPEALTAMAPAGVGWQRHTPWYGWRWAMRPLSARIAGRRVPSQFHIYLATRSFELLESL